MKYSIRFNQERFYKAQYVFVFNVVAVLLNILALSMPSAIWPLNFICLLVSGTCVIKTLKIEKLSQCVSSETE
jgi:hypothetical protein